MLAMNKREFHALGNVYAKALDYDVEFFLATITAVDVDGFVKGLRATIKYAYKPKSM